MKKIIQSKKKAASKLNAALIQQNANQLTQLLPTILQRTKLSVSKCGTLSVYQLNLQVDGHTGKIHHFGKTIKYFDNPAILLLSIEMSASPPYTLDFDTTKIDKNATVILKASFDNFSCLSCRYQL